MLIDVRTNTLQLMSMVCTDNGLTASNILSHSGRYAVQYNAERNLEVYDAYPLSEFPSYPCRKEEGTTLHTKVQGVQRVQGVQGKGTHDPLSLKNFVFNRLTIPNTTKSSHSSYSTISWQPSWTSQLKGIVDI